MESLPGEPDSLPARAAAQMRTDARSLVQDLDGRGRRVDLDQFVDQVIGHAVETAVEGDVVVDVHAGLGPLAEVERFAW